MKRHYYCHYGEPNNLVADCDCVGDEARTASTFKLDKFEVTVGRFRNFVDTYDELLPPEPGVGAHPVYPETGWNPEWDGQLPASEADFRAALREESYHVRDGALGHPRDNCQGWSDEPEGAEDHAMYRCVSWAEAQMFCAWDGGRLPTAAEWMYAAAGGAENRVRPWGGCLDSDPS